VTDVATDDPSVLNGVHEVEWTVPIRHSWSSSTYDGRTYHALRLSVSRPVQTRAICSPSMWSRLPATGFTWQEMFGGLRRAGWVLTAPRNRAAARAADRRAAHPRPPGS
jgi:hypothetical protein